MKWTSVLNALPDEVQLFGPEHVSKSHNIFCQNELQDSRQISILVITCSICKFVLKFQLDVVVFFIHFSKLLLYVAVYSSTAFPYFTHKCGGGLGTYSMSTQNFGALWDNRRYIGHIIFLLKVICISVMFDKRLHNKSVGWHLSETYTVHCCHLIYAICLDS